MRLQLLFPVVLHTTVLLACSGTSPSPIADVPDALNETSAEAGPSNAEENVAHALGVIVLGETHASGASTAHGIVSVSFMPDAATVRSCTRVIAGCELTLLPKCSTACGTGEVCAMDASCTPKCQPTAAPAKESSFDGGPIAIAGATTPLTLYPPYASASPADGAPFLAGAQLRVQGSGALAAGFEKFEETFTATQFLQASPPLAQLPRSTVWSEASLPVTWAPGKDAVSVTVAGAGGSLRCKADDAKGRFDVPREVIKTALGPAPANNLTLTLARERIEIKKGHKTKGQLPNVSIQPVGWLSLGTTSVESASFQCTDDECTGTVPPTSCQNCRTSLCKTEFDACTADATCPMLRTCLDACSDSSCRNACFAKWPDPVAKTKNGALYKCQCVITCTTECAADCK